MPSGRSGSIVVHNAHVVTNDPGRPHARAVVVRDGIITYVGSDETALTEDRGIDVRIDAQGRTLIPGFNDAHGHFLHMGLVKDRADLSACRSLEETYATLRAFADAHPEQQVIIGEKWDQSGWTDPTNVPARSALDDIAGGRPVLARRVCGHVAYASSALLALYDERYDGDHSLIDHKSGLLLEEPAMRFSTVVPSTPVELEAAARRFMREAAREGVTSAQEFASVDQWRAWQQHRRRADRDGTNMGCRLDVSTYVDHLAGFVAAGIETGLGDDWLAMGGVKIFADGSLGAWTAALDEPYSDKHETCGVKTFDDETLVRLVEQGHDAGLQQRMHVIGDAAVEQGTRAFERVAEHTGLDAFRAMRHRFEHYEMSSKSQRDRAKTLGAVLSMQPNFVGTWSRADGLYGQRLGDRHRTADPFRLIHDEGHALAFGSDSMPFGPITGLRGVVGAPYPTMRLDLVTAIRHYTFGGAHAQHREHVKGLLRAGMLGDLVLLNKDLGSEDANDPAVLEGLAVTHTVLDGKIVYGTA